MRWRETRVLAGRAEQNHSIDHQCRVSSFPPTPFPFRVLFHNATTNASAHGCSARCRLCGVRADEEEAEEAAAARQGEMPILFLKLLNSDLFLILIPAARKPELRVRYASVWQTKETSQRFRPLPPTFWTGL